MIKRIIATLTICLIITGLISPVFSNASAVPQPNWTDPGISEIINISDLTGWMLNGGTFDVSTYTDSESFMTDYYYGRTSTRLVDGNDLYYNQFGIGQDLYNIGSQSYNSKLDTVRMMSSSFREHSGYGRRFSEEANKTLLDSGNLYDMKIPLLNEVEFANFVGYNHNALRLYSEFFTSGSITPNPDPNYELYINIANGIQNGMGFFWTNYPLYYSSVISYNNMQLQINYNINDCSWYCYNLSQMPSQPYYADGMCACGPLTLNITYDGTQYTGVISNITHYDDLASLIYGSTVWPISCLNFGPSNSSIGLQDIYNYPSSSVTYSGTLDSVLSYFCYRFHNINIYVDGEPWAIINDPSNQSLTPEFPDVIGGEELPTSTWQVYRPRAPYYTSVPGMLQAIDDAIQGDGKLDIDDLKPYLTDENGDPVPDPVFDPEPVPIPVPDPVNPDVVPQLPELPAMPLDMPGFNGVSVLAEIINFTNQSLPYALIVTFWGIVFGIVILGLIKILHK